jgi:peroxiredoxin
MTVMAIFSCAALCLAASGPPLTGEPFPDLKLPVPAESEHLKYLGLGPKAEATFTLDQVKANVVILEVFSMYCPYCQNEAPSINALYAKIAERGFDDRVKLIGLGAGNSSYEVGLFKGKFGIKFPLLPDNDLRLHTALGQVRTPYFIVVSLKPDGSQQVIYSKVGTIGDPVQFLDSIIQTAGLQ